MSPYRRRKLKAFEETAMAEAQTSGTIVQCIGAVIDIEFPRDAMPGIYDALVLEDSGEKSFAEEGLSFEVEQQLGDGVVRCISLGSSDGLRRGMKVKSTGSPISVPVGKGTRLHSSHDQISYAVFCLKEKNGEARNSAAR